MKDYWTERAIKGYERQKELMAREYPNDKEYQDYLLKYQYNRYDIESKRDNYCKKHGSLEGFDKESDMWSTRGM